MVNSWIGLAVTPVYPDGVLGVPAPLSLAEQQKGEHGRRGHGTSEYILYLCLRGFLCYMAKLIDISCRCNYLEYTFN